MGRPRIDRAPIRAALRDGQSPRQVADSLGVSLSTVRRIAADDSDTAPTECESIQDLLAQWLVLAATAQSRALEEVLEGGAGNALAYTAGVASQRALDLQRYIDTHEGIPDELPDDPQEQQEQLRRLAYRRARGGAASGLRDALEAAQRDTRIELVWADADEGEA